MIIGIGVDIIEISRIEKACMKDRFLKNIFTEKEIELCLCEDGKKRVSSLAGNFAVKEAVSKAFGTGVRKFTMRDIEVLRNELDMPYVVLHNGAKAVSDKIHIKKISVSISHNTGCAVGFAVAEGFEGDML